MLSRIRVLLIYYLGYHRLVDLLIAQFVSSNLESCENLHVQ